MGKTKDLSRQFSIKILQMVTVVAVAMLMFVCMAMQAHAATAKITASAVKIRKEASTGSEQIGSAANGDSFTIQSEVTGADGYTWYQITFDGDKVGYIRSDLASKSGDGTGTTTPTIDTSGVTPIQPISAKVTKDQVRVRPDASTNGSVVTTVASNTVVAVNGKADGGDGKVWYYVSFQTSSGEVTGFIREDFLELAGEIIPVDTSEPEPPVADDPVVEEPQVVEKDYETLEIDGVWYLINNTTDPAYQYKIQDIFDAAQKNADLYEGSLKTVKTQKIFIIILVLLLVGGGVAATLIIFKMKDMMDEAYFAEVEKETLNKRQNKQQNVMHTVGKDAVQKKPTVNGQQRSVSQGKPVSGQPRQMPKQAPAGTQPKPNGTAGNQQKSAAKPQGQAVKPQEKVQTQSVGNTAAQPAKPQPEKTQGMAKPEAKPQNVNGQAKPANAKANQEWKSKNFMSDDDDDFEFEFLNWDGEEEL